ncbi:response regulator transcription factor [Pontibacter pamirensis]|uniref:response regulator transcription factor n=1 Tax=Pontibacter pamirensis TaxID=2562824 RepID=UPI00138966A2|nr:response regulator transcription factor [Pontibacter pamirensis]
MAENKLIRVVLTDDHNIIREGLRSLLEDDKETVVVGEASNGKELLDLLEHTPADVVLMDINMPVMDGYEATKQVAERFPDTKVLALSMLNSEPFVQKMMENGAAGYILKNTGKAELQSAIKLVANGSKFMCADLAIKFLHKPSVPEEDSDKPSRGGSVLSKRELEVLGLIAEGFTNAEIADKLFTSKRTIETHRQNILEKTNAKNTANLVKYAIQNGYISIDT